jgi:hypothetical protein
MGSIVGIIIIGIGIVTGVCLVFYEENKEKEKL